MKPAALPGPALVQYDGRVFDDYDEAGAHAESIGYPELMRSALSGRATESISTPATRRWVATYSAVPPPLENPAATNPSSSASTAATLLGAEQWPADVAAQIHYTADDPFRRQEWVDAVSASVRAAGAALDLFDYPGAGHCSPTRRSRASTSSSRLICCGGACWPSHH